MEITLKPPTNEERRLTYGDRLRRGRENAGLTQREAAERLGVDQKVIARAERGQASEDTLGAFEDMIDLRDSYPAAPKDPVRRMEWFEARNAGLQNRKVA